MFPHQREDNILLYEIERERERGIGDNIYSLDLAVWIESYSGWKMDVLDRC